jgi:hypothetical protein
MMVNFCVQLITSKHNWINHIKKFLDLCVCVCLFLSIMSEFSQKELKKYRFLNVTVLKELTMPQNVTFLQVPIPLYQSNSMVRGKFSTRLFTTGSFVH